MSSTDRNNRTCKECGRKYHHCDSCGYEFIYNEDEFCSERCSRMNEQGPRIIASMERLLNKLDDQGKEDLACILSSNKPKTCGPGSYGDREYYESDEDHPYDEDLVKDIIENRFRGKSGIEAWGLW